MFKNSKLSRYKALKIVECFCIDIDATKTALLLKLNRKTVNRYFLAFRALIYAHQVSQKEHILGVVEVDECFLPSQSQGTPRSPQKRPRHTQTACIRHLWTLWLRIHWAGSKLLGQKTLQAIIRGKISPESVIHSDGWRGYDGLVDVGYDKHFRRVFINR